MGVVGRNVDLNDMCFVSMFIKEKLEIILRKIHP